MEPSEEVVQGVKVEEPETGGRMWALGGGVRDRARAGVGVVLGGGAAGVAGVGGDTGGVEESKVR